ncbi:hypothetical protein GCM10010193_02840 [Kitasatospora atroaurantiaca]|uniref:Tat pathway signal sequence domain protein n=1 Tax=Kitasatospora atroaurantiaca TaxID=285545 RepID=A0A561ELL2_9ACTN|nr:Tat pathway signal sequence domain protein [Kitasatospora atroaurantiaca]TWE16505.1 hypothetical protein FB465_1487 [Kitasatospora atroaurantiaca]
MSGTGHGSEQPGGSYGALGPVEAAEGAKVVPHAPLPRRGLTRRQWYALAALLLAGGTLLVARHAADRPAQAANSPPPYPVQVSGFSYGGQLREAAPGGHEFTLRVLATATGPFPYEIVEAHQSYRGITTTVVGTALPRTVEPGRQVEFDVVYLVTDCAAAPRDAGLPFLDVTLRNTRAIQTVSQILGDGYARDLSRNLHITCPDSGIRT